jgi:pimeloyl-[acyl-carrier protein] methyl ester esterase
MPFFQAGPGRTLHYEDAGAGSPLVAVHGWSLSAGFLADAVGPAAPGRRVVALDLRGHGRSPAGATPFALDDLADDLAALFEALRLEGAVLLGWSLGAQVALAALPRVRRRVSALVLVSATPRFTESEGWPHGLPGRTLAALARHVARDPGRAAERFFEGMFADGELDPDGRARALAARAAARVPDAATLLAGLDVLGAADLRAGLGGADLPALVVHGGRDPVCLPGAGRAIAAALPAASLALLPDAGHAPFLSRPAAFADRLGAFLGAHE